MSRQDFKLSNVISCFTKNKIRAYIRQNVANFLQIVGIMAIRIIIKINTAVHCRQPLKEHVLAYYSIVRYCQVMFRWQEYLMDSAMLWIKQSVLHNPVNIMPLRDQTFGNFIPE